MYLLGLVFLLSACKSVQKLVDKGEYDAAIELAARKLHGDKNRKTKHVKGLETAFAKITRRDMDYVQYLKDQNDDANWDRIYDRLQTIKRRQYTVEPFLPLISKDGYVAHFAFVRVDPLLIEAADRAASYHYEEAERLLEIAEDGDKKSARRAYDNLHSIDRYHRNYLDADHLKSKALSLGRTRTLVKSESSINAYLPSGFHDELLQVNVSDLNSLWQEFHTLPMKGVTYDLHAILEIEQVEVSPEREKESIYVETKEIADGKEVVFDRNGNAVKDSLGNVIKTDRYVTIRAEVVELLREKAAYVKGHFRVIDANSGQVIDRKPIATEKLFSSYASRYNGDRRALSKKTHRRMRTRPDPFPTDFELIWETTDEIKTVMKDELRRNIW